MKRPTVRDKAAEREAKITHDMGVCVHFQGIQHDKCKAGVDWRQLTGGLSLGIALRTPCMLEHDQCTVTCDKRQFPTREEAERAAAHGGKCKGWDRPRGIRAPAGPGRGTPAGAASRIRGQRASPVVRRVSMQARLRERRREDAAIAGAVERVREAGG